MRRAFVALTMMSFVMTIPVLSQESDLHALAKLMFFQHQLRVNLADVSLDSPVFKPQFAFSIDEKEDSRTAKAIAGLFLCRGSGSDCLANNPIGFHVKLTSGLGKNDKSVNLVSLRGLSAKTTGEVGFFWTNAPKQIDKHGPTNDRMRQAIVHIMAAEPVRLSKIVQQLPIGETDKQQLFQQMKSLSLKKKDPSNGEFKTEFMKTTTLIDPIVTQIAESAEKAPLDVAVSDLVNELSYAMRPEYLTLPDPSASVAAQQKDSWKGMWAAPVQVAATFTFARPSFTWADKPDFSIDQTARHASWAGSFFFGTTPMIGTSPTARFYAGVSYTRKSQFDAADTDTICTPLPNGAVGTHCRDIANGAPTKKKSNVAELEYRQFFRHIGVNPKVSYDWTKRVHAIELPFYLRQDATKDFAGGLKLGWESKTHSITAAAFVSMAPKVGLP